MTRRSLPAVVAVVTVLSVACDASTELASTPTSSAATAATTIDAPVTVEAPATTVGPDSTPPPGTVPDSAVAATTSPAAPSCLAGLSVRERAALLVWPAVYSNAWDEAIATVRDHGVGGVLLMKPSGWTADDVAPRLAELEEVATLGLVIATDEEGGNVQRLDLLGELPSQQDASEQSTPDDAATLIAGHAATLRDVGVDMVFAPVVDVVPPNGEVALDRSRFFTGDASTVTALGRAFIEAWASAGVVPVVKHFPGHGSASADSHLDASVTPPLPDLMASDLIPFRELAATGAAVMVGHLTVPDLTDGIPATRSPEAIELLRETLGYGDRLVISDALEMGAVGLPIDQAAVASIAAGLDVALFTDTSSTGDVIAAIERAVVDGSIPQDRLDESARRVLRVTGAQALGCDPG